MVETYFDLDMSVNKQNTLNISQYDNNSRIINIALFNNGIRVNIPKDCTARIKMRKPDGNKILNDCEIIDNYVQLIIDEQETASFGKGVAELLITNRDSEILYSTDFNLIIKKSVYPSDEVISTSEYGSLEKALIRADYDIYKMEELIDSNNVVHVEDVLPKVQRNNLLHYPYYSKSEKKNGITFTINTDDGSINASGIATANASFYLTDKYLVNTGVYTLSGCPNDGSDDAFYLYIQNADESFSIVCKDYGEGATFNLQKDTNLRIGLYVLEGQNINITFYPMLEKGKVIHDYIPTTVEEFHGVIGADSDGKVRMSSVYHGEPNTLAELDENGKVPEGQLPSYVDDVLDGYCTAIETSAGTYSTSTFYKDKAKTQAYTPESDKIYIDVETNIGYRWSGTVYVSVGTNLILGELSTTAYRGDRGKIAYDHSQVTSGNPHKVTKSEVGLSNVTNNAQVKGLASGTTAGHVVNWGSDGYTVADSGYTIAKSVPSNAKFTDTTYSDATQSNSGLMSSADKKKIDGIATGATAVNESTVNGWGFTKNVGTITGIKMNGSSKGTSGEVDLGTVITSHQDISGKENASNKVTSWSSTTTDAHYPSEKLVKSELDKKQSNLTSQTAYSKKGTSTKVPQITTNSLGQVTSISEVDIAGSSEVFDMVSDEWTQRTYQKGEYAISENKLWKCLVPNNVKPSEGSNWTQVRVGNEISTINSNLSELNTILTNKDNINFKVGIITTTLNAPDETGIYYVTGATGALPSDFLGYGLLINLRSPYSLHPTTASGAVWVQYYIDVANRRATRAFNNGKWTSWSTF